jgi:hypothetical protein
MDIIRAFLGLLLLPVGALPAASGAGFEFDGVVVDGGHTRVALLDLRTGAAGWVRVGGKFAGYLVAAYDAAQDTVTLTREGEPAVGVQLKTAVILVAPPLPVWRQPSNEQRAAVAENLRQLATAAAQYFSDTGATAATLDELVGPGKLLEQLVPATGESYLGIVLQRDTPTVSIITPDGTSITSDGASIASDGSRILADGGRVTSDGTHLAPDGSVVVSNPPAVATRGPYIPPNATPQLATALEAAGWSFRPASP